MRKTRILSLDLELNQPSQKIIQIGYAIGDITTKEILKTGSIFVDPKEPLNPEIIALTGIEDSMVQGAGTLQEAYAVMRADFIAYDCFINPITWGGGDTTLLREQLGLEGDRWIFGRRWFDVKTLAFHERIKQTGFLNVQGGLAKSMRWFDLSFKGRKHNAMDDAVNTLRLYFKLLERV